MDDWIIWACLQTGGSHCYVLSTGEKLAYLAGFTIAGMAIVLLLYGTVIRIFTR
jgi:hypothetical protein